MIHDVENIFNESSSKVWYITSDVMIATKITLFITSAINRKKAKAVSLSMHIEDLPTLRYGGVCNRPLPSLGIAVRLWHEKTAVTLFRDLPGTCATTNFHLKFVRTRQLHPIAPLIRWAWHFIQYWLEINRTLLHIIFIWVTNASWQKMLMAAFWNFPTQKNTLNDQVPNAFAKTATGWLEHS